MIELRIVGYMDYTMDNTFESANRVYDKNGLCPTLNTCGGGGLEPKVVDRIYEDKTGKNYCKDNA